MILRPLVRLLLANTKLQNVVKGTLFLSSLKHYANVQVIFDLSKYYVNKEKGSGFIMSCVIMRFKPI